MGDGERRLPAPEMDGWDLVLAVGNLDAGWDGRVPHTELTCSGDDWLSGLRWR